MATASLLLLKPEKKTTISTVTFEMQSLRAAVKNNVYSCSVCITLIFVLKFDFDRVFLNVGPPPPTWLKKKQTKKKVYSGEQQKNGIRMCPVNETKNVPYVNRFVLFEFIVDMTTEIYETGPSCASSRLTNSSSHSTFSRPYPFHCLRCLSLTTLITSTWISRWIDAIPA